METKPKLITINDKFGDFGDIMIMALRYGLGRRTYVSSEIPDFIMQNREHITERVCIVMLRDIHRYAQDRTNGMISDDICDYNSWIELQNWLFNLAREKQFDVIGFERR